MGDTGVEELTELLIQHRKKVEDKLSTFQRNLQLLNKKIAFYQGELQKNESKNLFTIFVQENRSERDWSRSLRCYRAKRFLRINGSNRYQARMTP